MPVTGVYFLPTIPNSTAVENPSLQLVLARLQAQYNITPSGRWTLNHHLFRGATLKGATDTLSDDSSRAASSRYLQLIYISTHSRNSYVSVTTTSVPSQTRAGTPATSSSGGESNGEPASIFSIPSGPQSEEFVQLIVARMGSLWTPRQVLQVSNGQVFEIGDFRIRLGEVKQGQGGAQQVKGVVTEVEWLGGDEDDLVIGEEVIKSLWSALDMKGAREYIRVPGFSQGLGNIRQWCEALRLRV